MNKNNDINDLIKEFKQKFTDGKIISQTLITSLDENKFLFKSELYSESIKNVLQYPASRKIGKHLFLPAMLDNNLYEIFYIPVNDNNKKQAILWKFKIYYWNLQRFFCL